MTDSDKSVLLNVIQQVVPALADKTISINDISSYDSIDNTSGIKFSATKNNITIPFFIGFTNDPKYSDGVVLGILNSDRNEEIDNFSLEKDNSGNLICIPIKSNYKLFSKKESIQIKKLSKYFRYGLKSIFFSKIIYNKTSKKEVESSFKNEKPTREDNKTSTKAHEETPKKKIESYDNISAGTWFKIVEIPWVIIILGIGVYCIRLFIQRPTELQTKMILGFSLGLFVIGFIGILANIDKKKKIREAKGLTISKNPYSWFLSKIGKIVCGTFCFVLGYSLKFIFTLFKEFLLSSGSSSGSSSYSTNSHKSSITNSTSSSSSNSSNTTNSVSSSFTITNNNNVSRSTTKIITYYCKYCGIKSGSIAGLTGSTCPRHPNGYSKGHHEPYQGSEKKIYYCEYCGIKSSSIAGLQVVLVLDILMVILKVDISHIKVMKKKQYFCKYCGISSSSIASLTSSTCPRHPNGNSKGHHVPSL